jgi:uncharacterized protein YceH (UPF0502 family)
LAREVLVWALRCREEGGAGRSKPRGMSIVLNASEIRVLGALIEKRMTTPDSYPLTLNALVAACNQSSNRYPIVEYDQFLVNDALINTRNQGLSALISRSGARAHKFAEKLCEKLQLSDKESALLAELMLRGPQTPGELRQRASRMAELPDLAEVEKLLEGLAARSTPLVVQLPRQPGKREARYAHLLAGEDGLASQESAPEPAGAREQGLAERVAVLEAQMAEVLARLEGLA